MFTVRSQEAKKRANKKCNNILLAMILILIIDNKSGKFITVDINSKTIEINDDIKRYRGQVQ